MKQETDEHGCFYFGDEMGGSDLKLRVAKVGYKPYGDGKEIGSYIVIVRLASEDDDQQSSAIWEQSVMGEISKNKGCSKQ